MVKQVFEYLADKLAALQMFELVIPIAEIIDKADGSFPAYYIGQGNYRPIDLSGYAGVGYFRKVGSAQFSKAERETFVGCETLQEVILPVRLVLSVKKTLLDIDTGFASSYLFEEMIRVFSGNHPTMADKAGISDAEVLMKSSEDDRLKIFANEYTGSTLRELPYDWIMVMVDMDIRLQFLPTCMSKFCDGYGTVSPIECPEPSSPIAQLSCASFIKIQTIKDVYEYIDNRLLAVTEFGLLTLDGQGISAGQYSITGNKLTLSDSEGAIDRDNMDIIIQVK